MDKVGSKKLIGSRTSRRRGTKAKYRKGSATWCIARGIPPHGQGANNKSKKK